MSKHQPKKNRIFQFFFNLYSGLFPKKFHLPEEEFQLLQNMFPNIDWKHVRCYNGLPWYMQHTFAIATALPRPYSLSGVNIYFRNYHPNDYYTRIILVHEAFHVLQYEEMRKKSFGFGFSRRFMRHYIAWFIALFFKAVFNKTKISKAADEAYFQHPLEIGAYSHERQFSNSFFKFIRNREFDVLTFFQHYPHLICDESGYGNTRPPFWAWIPASLLTVLISLLKPFIELLLLLLLSPVFWIASFSKSTK